GWVSSSTTGPQGQSYVTLTIVYSTAPSENLQLLGSRASDPTILASNASLPGGITSPPGGISSAGIGSSPSGAEAGAARNAPSAAAASAHSRTGRLAVPPRAPTPGGPAKK